MPKQTLIVPEELAGARADRVLATLLPDYSRMQLTHWLKSGVITIGDTPTKPKIKLKGGETITIHQTLTAQTTTEHIAPENIPLDIVYEDEDILVVNKAAGLVVHPGAGNPSGTLVNALIYHNETLNQLPRAGIIHRIDKETTGLLVVAKTLEAHTALSRDMQAREIDRRYIALVQGHLISSGKIETGFGRHPRNRLKMAVTEGGKEAITHYTIKKQYPELPATLLDVKLMTGRTHQIRVHMAHIYHAIVGDPLYAGRPRHPKGLDDATRELFLNFKRQALHAASLTFTHPKTQETLSFTADLPNDFKALLNALDESD